MQEYHKIFYCFVAIDKERGMYREMQYKYKDIITVDKNGIIMYDSFVVKFQECNEKWKKINNTCNTNGIGIRDITAEKPYFKFFMGDMVIEILFDKKGLFKKWRNERDFHRFMQCIYMSGYSTFDMS